MLSAHLTQPLRKSLETHKIHPLDCADMCLVMTSNDFRPYCGPAPRMGELELLGAKKKDELDGG